MKKMIALVLSLTFTMANAQDDNSKPTPEVIEEAKTLCEEYAAEDSIADADMKDYLLNCVNQELEAQGYQTIDELK